MVVVGGVAPARWPRSQDKITQIAADLAIDQTIVEQHIDQVLYLSTEQQAQVLDFVQRIADIITHILTERNHLFSKLSEIAKLTKV